MKLKDVKCKIGRTIIAYLMLIVLIVAMIPAVSSEASAKSVALSKYRQLLKNSRVSVIPRGKRIWVDDNWRFETYYSSKASNVKFCIGYIDGDSVPDLVLYDRKYGYGVWTFIGKSFRCLHWDDSDGIPVGYYKKKGVFRSDRATEGSPFYRVYYKVQTGKNPFEIQSQFCNDGHYGVENLGFYIGNSGKKVTSAAFYKNLKKYTGGTKMSLLYMHANTSGNRKKYIK